MRHNIFDKFFVALLTLVLMVTGCQQEDIQLSGEQNVKGRIVLSLSDIEIYVDAQTRTTQTLNDFSGYTFTLNGVGVESGNISQEITFDANGTAIIEAGTYTLMASNRYDPITGSDKAYTAPYWEGTSSQFTLSAGTTEPVSIIMGKPQNAKVSIVQNTSFSTLYQSVTLTQNGHSVTFPTDDDVYFLPGSVTLSATAKLGSHVTDMTSVSITLERGTHHTITLSANSVTGEIIPVVSGTHTGTFD